MYAKWAQQTFSVKGHMSGNVKTKFVHLLGGHRTMICYGKRIQSKISTGKRHVE